MKNHENINLQDITGKDSSYEVFKQKLIEVEQFPTLFVFKFIVPTAENAKSKIEKIFEHPSTKINTKNSGGGKYESFTVESFVNTADDVVNYYKEVGKIDKVMML
jgi:putative lipoic acid-binding regulatory protein